LTAPAQKRINKQERPPASQGRPEMPDIILHQWEISPYCGKVRRILAFKGLPFSVREYSGWKIAQVGRLSKVGKLPVLEYEGELIQDSTVIAKFIEKKHPDPLLYPLDGMAAHLAHVFEDWADESLYWYEVYFRFMYPEAADAAFSVIQKGRPAYEKKLILMAAIPMMRRKLKAQGLGRYEPELVTQHFMAHVQHLEGILAAQPWLVGESCTIADIAVAAQLAEVRRTSHLGGALDRFPALSAWLNKLG
jgi:glutathione S-transferase